MSAAVVSSLRVAEVPAPAGWSAGLLECDLPTGSEERASYAGAVLQLRRAIAAIIEAPQHEVFLLFERCRPEVEIPVLQRNARSWMPQVGLAVKVGEAAPHTWTAQEFAAAAPGTLRPVIDRILRLSRDAAAQESAWHLLGGSGALVSVSATVPERFVAQSTATLLPRIQDSSLTSFPFYVPLLTAGSLNEAHADFGLPLQELIPQGEVYLRESVEDGGLLIVVRREPGMFWPALLRAPMSFSLDVRRASPLPRQQGG